MPYAVREYECAGCGVPVSKRGKAGAQARCIDCSIERSIQAVYQLRGQHGEFYDRWAAGIKAAADRAVIVSAIGREIDSIG